jgi:hypothetical protein
MVFSEHSLLRFVQRVIGIADKSDALKFIRENKYEVYYKLLKFINESELLHDKFSPEKDGVLYNYHINGDILIVIAYPQDIVVTLYDIKVDLNSNANSIKIRQLFNKIKSNKGQIIKNESKRSKNDNVSKKLEGAVEYRGVNEDELLQKLKESIGRSKEFAGEAKELRTESRDMMIDIMYGFKKL